MVIPSPLKSLVHDALGRHGFRRHLFAHEVVKEANAQLAQLLPPAAREDVHAVSVRTGNILTLACRHAPARAAAETIIPELTAILTISLPNITVQCQLDPTHFSSPYGV